MNSFKFFLANLFIFLLCGISFAQVGIGTTTPDASAELDVTSTTKGFLPSRMTTTQRNAITSPATGLTIYNTTTNCTEFFNGTIWTTPNAQINAANDPTFTNNSVNSVSSDWIKGYAQSLATSPVAFSAYANAATTLTTGTHTLVKFEADIFDPTNAFNGTRFNPQVAGFYQINFQVEVVNNATGRSFADLRKNNDQISRSIDIGTLNPVELKSVTGSTLTYLNGTTDYLEVFCYTSVAGSVTSTGIGATSFSGFLTNPPAQFAQAIVTAATDPTFTNNSNQAVSADWVQGLIAPSYGRTVNNTNVTVTGTTTANATTIMTFTLPSAGTWDVTYTVRQQNGGNGAEMNVALYDQASVLVPDSQLIGTVDSAADPTNVNVALTTNGSIFITTTAAATYSIRGWSNNSLQWIAFSNSAGKTSVKWVKIQ